MTDLQHMSQNELDALLHQLEYVRHALGQITFGDERAAKAGDLVDGIWRDATNEQVKRLSE